MRTLLTMLGLARRQRPVADGEVVCRHPIDAGAPVALASAREIGIRMAIGARGSDVLVQLLVESIVMSLIGGIIGLFAGYGGSMLLGRITGWHTFVPVSAVFLAVGFSAAVSVFFGFYPARKAAGMNPIEALRHE